MNALPTHADTLMPVMIHPFSTYLDLPRVFGFYTTDSEIQSRKTERLSRSTGYFPSRISCNHSISVCSLGCLDECL